MYFYVNNNGVFNNIVYQGALNYADGAFQHFCARVDADGKGAIFRQGVKYTDAAIHTPVKVMRTVNRIGTSGFGSDPKLQAGETRGAGVSNVVCGCVLCCVWMCLGVLLPSLLQMPRRQWSDVIWSWLPYDHPPHHHLRCRD